MTDAEFGRAVERALAGLPAELRAATDNVAIMIEAEDAEEPDIYGLYRGTPLTERSSDGYAGSLPDTIAIYRRPLVEDFGDDEAELVEQIRVTVVHELGHHFGIDDAELDRLGWG